MPAKQSPIAVHLEGLKVESVRPMTAAECRAEGWNEDAGRKPSVIVFDDGTKLFASQDPEGNGAGCLFGVAPGGTRFRE